MANAKSSNSHFKVFMPSRWARGAKISSVSLAFFCCLLSGNQRSVRMLCRRSASLITSTRISRAIATIILRTVSAAVVRPYSTLSNLVTPSTSSPISGPKSFANASRV